MTASRNIYLASTASLPERVNKYATVSPDGCWIWKGGTTRAGYPQTSVDGRVVYVRRWLYEELVGAIPEGQHLMSTCRVRSCVCPFHLEPRTPRALIQETLGSPQGSKKHYPSGYVAVKHGEEWIYEHRIVMSEVLGRPLAKGESVHHINGDRADNRPENLQLLRAGHARGHAHRCLDCGSSNVVEEPLEVSVADH